MRTLKSNKSYSYKQRGDSAWFDVFFKDKLIAMTMNVQTARQVIYRESKSEKYLHDEDFEDA